jgi:hypothetical protein
MNRPLGIVVADVEDDQFSAIVVLRRAVGVGRAVKSVYRVEADRVMVEHRLKNAADGALLGPDLDTDRLLVPEVASI